ncbi:MAG: hypothetical protein LCI02_04975 [Proteobacteria bacterium]|nr:hypothetical protein [Pseudomonadota bacterium]
MNQPTRRTFISVAAITIALAGCATTGNDTWSAALPRLQPGQSTAAEVASMLGGPPRNIMTTAKGNQLHQWLDAGRSLSMVFDKQGRLLSVVQTLNVPISEADRKRLFLPPA